MVMPWFDVARALQSLPAVSAMQNTLLMATVPLVMELEPRRSKVPVLLPVPPRSPSPSMVPTSRHTLLREEEEPLEAYDTLPC